MTLPDNNPFDQQWMMNLPVKVEFGSGCLERLPDHLADYKKAVLLTGKSAMKAAGITDRITHLLKEAGVECLVIDRVQSDPDCEAIEQAAAMARDFGAQVAIGCGGGSAIDTAKAVAVAAMHSGPLMEYIPTGPREITSATLPIVAISATSGTGSHVGRISVISDHSQKLKRSLISDYLTPKVAICDPQVLRTMPAEVTACTGFDAFAQALEGYLSASENPVGNLCAREAIRIIYQTLPQVLADGDNLDHRAQMAWADTLAGISLATNLIIIPHSLSMVLGGRYEITHARAVAVVTIACLRHSRDGALAKLADVARLMGYHESASDQDQADRAIESIERLITASRIKKNLKEYGVLQTDLDDIADEMVTTYQSRIQVDPKPTDKNGILRILQQSFQS